MWHKKQKQINASNPVQAATSPTKNVQPDRATQRPTSFGASALYTSSKFQGTAAPIINQPPEVEILYQLSRVYPSTELDQAQFWEINKERMPILYKLAKKVLFIPATSVSCESLFSELAYLFQAHGVNLLRRNVEILIAYKAWLKPEINELFYR